MKIYIFQIKLILIIAILVLAGGCSGSPRASVEGKVTFDGNLIERGSIRFIPIQNTSGPTAGATITGGTYSIPQDKGPFPGVYRVEIHATRKTGRMVPDATTGRDVPEYQTFIPPHYNENSTLQVTIKPGSNQLDFALRANP